MSSDSSKRMYEGITDILNDFGIPYEDVRKSRHPAIEFYINGKRTLFTYSSSGDPRAWLNNRSKLQRMLLNSGLIPKSRITLPSVITQSPSVPISFKEELLNGTAQIPQPEEEPVVFETTQSEPIVETIVMPSIEIIEETPKLKLNPDEAYLLYEPKALVPGKVIVIELDHELIAEKGSVLIVPLHKPSGVIPMSRQQFEAMFQTIEDVPKPEPVIVKEPEPPEETLDEFEIRNLREEPETSLEEMPELFPEVVTPIEVKKIPEGVSAFKKPRKIREAKPSDNPYRIGPSSIDGCGPQLARLLVAMNYIYHKKHKQNQIPADLDGLLTPPDRKQVSARVLAAIRLGYVERGLPSAYGRGYLNKLTTSGMEIAKRLKGWGWLYDGLEVPDWLK